MDTTVMRMLVQAIRRAPRWDFARLADHIGWTGPQRPAATVIRAGLNAGIEEYELLDLARGVDECRECGTECSWDELEDSLCPRCRERERVCANIEDAVQHIIKAARARGWIATARRAASTRSHYIEITIDGDEGDRTVLVRVSDHDARIQYGCGNDYEIDAHDDDYRKDIDRMFARLDAKGGCDEMR